MPDRWSGMRRENSLPCRIGYDRVVAGFGVWGLGLADWSLGLGIWGMSRGMGWRVRGSGIGKGCIAARHTPNCVGKRAACKAYHIGLCLTF